MSATNTKSFPDISEWYTSARVATEESIWTEGEHYKENISRIESLCFSQSLRTIIEVGCGTGWIPLGLDSSLHYLAGIDRNPHMLELARSKTRQKFIQMDMRDLHQLKSPYNTCDLVCSFAVLKHFSLTEWPIMLQSILSLGRFALFNQHALPNDRAPIDIGQEWHEIWPTRQNVLAAIASAGHEVIAWDDSHLNERVGAPESYITTRRIVE